MRKRITKIVLAICAAFSLTSVNVRYSSVPKPYAENASGLIAGIFTPFRPIDLPPPPPPPPPPM